MLAHCRSRLGTERKSQLGGTDDDSLVEAAKASLVESGKASLVEKMSTAWWRRESQLGGVRKPAW